MNKYDLVIFDLDGTLLDTSPGIFGSVRYAEEKLGLTPIADSELSQFVGPPPKSMYMKVYDLDDASASLAAKYHREYGREKAIYQATPYPYIKEVLIELKNNGHKLAVGTLKSQSIAEKVLEISGILECFDIIIGMDDKEQLTKSMIINRIIQITNSENVVMVGDSIYDYDGAKESNIDFLGVLYGFGFNKTDKYPFLTSSTTKEIIKKLMGDFDVKSFKK